MAEPACDRYCDVSLPVPVEQLFTYAIPQTMTGAVQRGCRVFVPFGRRALTGVVLKVHQQAPAQTARSIIKPIDHEPALGEELLWLGGWIATYYCAPLGEVLRAMLPLAGELRQSRTYALTDAGRAEAAQLALAAPEGNPAAAVLTLLAERPLTAASLARRVPGVRNTLASLRKRKLVTEDEQQDERDLTQAAANRLRVSFRARAEAGVRLSTAQREVLAFLELHPGAHNLAELAGRLKRASEAARALARRQLVTLSREPYAPAARVVTPVRVLNPQQQAALDPICAAIRQPGFHAFLLHGVTGSGKTEVYLQAIDTALSAGRQALLLVPEIALTPAMAGQFFARLGDRVAMLHSAVTDRERASQWRRIRAGEAPVVIGTRSAVFAPLERLGLLIVDEEHDGSYKQAESPRYQARDVGLIRAQRAAAVAVLGSATPTTESRYNAQTGRYTLLQMPERIGNRPMPEVELIDMRQEFLETRTQRLFSRRLLEAIGARLEQQEQVMLLQNRRGFANFLLCRACGERVLCANCSVALTLHKRVARMQCHYCGYAERIPKACPHCASDHIQFLGAGSERVEDELLVHFPRARVTRLDRDTAGNGANVERILNSFREGTTDILVGTQMIAKGHDVWNVTLMGVVLADIGLGVPDFRAAERTFQLMTQAAGRAGRGSVPGQVLVQTLNPEHYALQFAAAQDAEGFYQRELNFRRWLRYPPFAALAAVLTRATQQSEALSMAGELGLLLNPAPEGVRVMGPAEAPVARLKNEYRYQILLKAARRSVLRRTLERVREHARKQAWKPTALIIDVDPVNLQ